MRIDRCERRIAATPERLYRALTDREMVERWLPPEGARGVVEAFEPRPGGAFRMTLVFDVADGDSVGKTTDNTDVVEGAFVELVPERLVRQRFEFRSADPAFAGTMLMTWTLVPHADGTDVIVTAENVPPGIRPEDHQAGLTSSLANLAACVEQQDLPGG